MLTRHGRVGAPLAPAPAGQRAGDAQKSRDGFPVGAHQRRRFIRTSRTAPVAEFITRVWV